MNESNIRYKEFLENLPKYIESTLNIFDKKSSKEFFKKLNKAKRIFFTGTGSSLPSALFGAQYCVNNLGLNAQFLPNGGILSLKLNKKDLVFLSTQGFNRGDAEIIAKKVKDDGATLAVLTANQDSPFLVFADFVFYFTPFPEKLFCRPVGVQTGIVAMAKALTFDIDKKLLDQAISVSNSLLVKKFEKDVRYIVLSSGVGMPVAVSFSLSLREGCGIDSQVYDIETYGHGMYVSDQRLKHDGLKVEYILIDIMSDDHNHTSIERIKPFIKNSNFGLTEVSSGLDIIYAYVEILTYLANCVLKTNIENNYNMEEPYGKEENRYFHKTESYKLPNRKLEEFIKAISKKAEKTNKPILVEVSGGSCTGKSTFVKEIKNSFNDAQIISQDNYQLGKNFKDRKTSLYKFDDLKNFQIDQIFKSLRILLSGKSVIIPRFDLVENITIGQDEIKPQKVNILEGLYASFGILGKLSPFKLYIETPYYLRLLRRISRFVNSKQNSDTSVPLKHITTFVYLAHKNFVIKQKKQADLVLKGEEIMPVFLTNFSEEFKLVEKIKTLFKKETTEIILAKRNEEIYLGILQNKKCVYLSVIDEIIKKFLENVNWFEM